MGIDLGKSLWPEQPTRGMLKDDREGRSEGSIVLPQANLSVLEDGHGRDTPPGPA